MRREKQRLSLPSVEPRLPSWWLEDALAREGDPAPAPALAGDATADVAIVGGGYTGLWTALALRERAPELRVTLLEAEICGHGPSGRNGGFVHGYWGAFAVDPPGARRGAGARARARRGADHPRDPGVGRGARRGRVAARGRDARGVGRAGAGCRGGEGGGRRRAAWAATTRPSRSRREEVAQRVSSPVFRGGVFYPECATVHPGLLVRALRRAALDAGVTAARADAGDGRARGLAERARDAGRDPARARGRARDERGADRAGAGRRAASRTSARTSS